jgi:hypothetical protein
LAQAVTAQHIQQATKATATTRFFQLLQVRAAVNRQRRTGHRLRWAVQVVAVATGQDLGQAQLVQPIRVLLAVTVCLVIRQVVAVAQALQPQMQVVVMARLAATVCKWQ